MSPILPEIVRLVYELMWCRRILLQEMHGDVFNMYPYECNSSSDESSDDDSDEESDESMDDAPAAKKAEEEV